MEGEKPSEAAPTESMKTEVYHHAGDNQPIADHHEQEVLAESRVGAYWRANLQLLGGLLVIWFVVSFGFGILGREWLDTIQFFGFKLGFWWAQQGSILVFVALIFVYCWRMKRLERLYGVDDD